MGCHLKARAKLGQVDWPMGHVGCHLNTSAKFGQVGWPDVDCELLRTLVNTLPFVFLCSLKLTNGHTYMGWFEGCDLWAATENAWA